MTTCTCTDVKTAIHCNLTRSGETCISNPHSSQPATAEPPALNSDALTNTLAAILGGNAHLTNDL